MGDEKATPIDITPAPDPQPITEPKGTAVTLIGRIEDFWQGTAIVAIPNGGGGTVGVWTGIETGKIGDSVKIPAVVDDATRDTLAVKVTTFAKEIQLVDVARSKGLDVKAVTSTEGVRT